MPENPHNRRAETLTNDELAAALEAFTKADYPSTWTEYGLEAADRLRRSTK